MSDDFLRTLGICGVYEAMTGRSANHAEIKGMIREVKVRNHARVLKCADPLHADEHPSMLVNDEYNTFTCLSRGHRGGMLDLVRLVTGQQSATNAEAMAILRERAGNVGTLAYQPPPDARFSGGTWVKLEDERLVGTYDYTDENGKLLYQVQRFEGKHEGKRAKRFAQRRPLPDGVWSAEGDRYVYRGVDGVVHDRKSRYRDNVERPFPKTRWAYNLDGVRRVPYRLVELSAAAKRGAVIFVVEGEMHVNALIALGFAATTNAGGTGFTYPVEWARFFDGASAVYVIPDCDETGRFAAAERVLHIKEAAPIVASLDVWPWRTDKYDVINYLQELPRLSHRERAAQLQTTLTTAIATLPEHLRTVLVSRDGQRIASPAS